MSRTVIDLDDDLLVEVQKVLGTSSKVGTVNAALLEVAKRARRQEFIDAIKSGEIDLAHDSRTESAA